MKQSADTIARKLTRAISLAQKRGFRDSKTLGILGALALTGNRIKKSKKA